MLPLQCALTAKIGACKASQNEAAFLTSCLWWQTVYNLLGRRCYLTNYLASMNRRFHSHEPQLLHFAALFGLQKLVFQVTVYLYVVSPPEQLGLLAV